MVTQLDFNRAQIIAENTCTINTNVSPKQPIGDGVTVYAHAPNFTVLLKISKFTTFTDAMNAETLTA